MQSNNNNRKTTGVKKICQIDGANLSSTEDVVKVIQQEVATEGHKNCDDLTEILNTSGGIDIVWQNSDVSSERLGADFEAIVRRFENMGQVDRVLPTMSRYS